MMKKNWFNYILLNLPLITPLSLSEQSIKREWIQAAYQFLQQYSKIATQLVLFMLVYTRNRSMFSKLTNACLLS